MNTTTTLRLCITPGAACEKEKSSTAIYTVSLSHLQYDDDTIIYAFEYQIDALFFSHTLLCTPFHFETLSTLCTDMMME